jgi:hypothetical protein
VRGSRLARAVAAVENTNKVDQQTLRSIDRLGIADRIIFFDLNAATEKRDWVLEYAKELLAKDKQAFDKIGRDRGFKSGTDKILCVCRILREMPDVVAADRLPDAKASNKISRAAAASRPRRSRSLAKATLSMAHGLERKEGGNDAGAPCIDFAKGKCPCKKCSFKHAKANAAEEE